MGPFLRKYGVETTVDFRLYEIDGVDLKVDAAHAAGDTKVMKNEGAEANTTNGFTDEGQGYSIVLTATEMQAARVVLYIVDQGTKAWLDEVVIVETYGDASAMHAFDLDTAGATTADVAAAVWDEPKAGHVTAGTFGEEEQSHATTAEVSAVEAKVDNIQAEVDAIEADLVIIDDEIAVVDGNVDTLITNVGTVDTVVDAIKVTTDKMDDTLEDDGGTFRLTANALEEAPTGAGAGTTAQEVWEYATRGLTEEVDIAADQSLVTVGTVTEVSGLHANALAAIANAVLGYNFGSVTGEATRSMLSALRMLRNKVSVNRTTGIYTVYKENDTTPDYQGTLGVTATQLIDDMDPD